MPQQLMAFPFSIAANGYVNTVEDDTEDCYEQEIRMLIGTVLGERQLVPQYGMEDLAFDPYPISTLQSKIEKFGPPVEITDVAIQPLDDVRTNIVVEYEQITSETADADYLLGA